MLTRNKEIYINNDTSLKEIQTVFNESYPYLNIEFFIGKKKALNNKNKKFSANYQVKDFTFVTAPVAVDITPTRTIKEIEIDFKRLAGLTIEVFRKSGNVWNGISLTENWTLENQNSAGKFISSEMDVDVV